MGSIVTSNLHILILFIWIVSALTSSVTNEVRTAGTISTSNSSSIDVVSGSNKSVALVLQPASEPRNNANPSFVGEGGPISIAASTEHGSPIVPHLSSIPGNISTEESVSKESDDHPVITPRKGTQSKIVPRKGANQMIPDVKRTSLPLNETTFNDTKLVVEPSASTETIHIKEEPNADTNSSKSETTVKQLNVTSNTNTNASLHNMDISQQTSSVNVTSKTSSTRKHKPKPTVTIGESEIDKPIPASPTKSPPLGMPRKIDYIIPVVITLIALPLLGAATVIVYRQGRDCWDKRHYRRMDFLIDGMYND